MSGEVLSDTFEEGDLVEKDQLLYTIDSSDVSSTESQAQTSYSQALKAKYPTADISGTVRRGLRQQRRRGERRDRTGEDQRQQ
ncbi:MAG: hypothetical protein ACLUS6_12520 [Dysosmobacter sp.]